MVDLRKNDALIFSQTQFLMHKHKINDKAIEMMIEMRRYQYKMGLVGMEKIMYR